MNISTQDFLAAHFDMIRQSSIMRILEFVKHRAFGTVFYLIDFIKNLNQPIDEKCSICPEISSIFLLQNDSWDCGVACCGMILNWANLDKLKLYSDPIAVSKKPLWTIDLFMFLSQFDSLHVELYTLSFGIQSHHEQYEWYQEHLLDDMTRVNEKFQYAITHDMSLYKRSVTMMELQSRVRDETHCIVILLVDSLTLFRRKQSRYGYSDDYTGHYILLIKYDPQEDCFYYFNPAVDSGLQKVSSRCLEAARKHPATDEDIVFCTKRMVGVDGSRRSEEGNNTGMILY